MQPSQYLQKQALRIQLLEKFAQTERPEFRKAVRSLGNGVAAAVASELAKWKEVLDDIQEARRNDEPTS